MKAKVKKQFVDRYTKELYKVGQEIEVTKERFKDIQRFVEEVKEVKKETKKKK